LHAGDSGCPKREKNSILSCCWMIWGLSLMRIFHFSLEISSSLLTGIFLHKIQVMLGTGSPHL
jgi:hypothetical protein